MYKRPTYEPHIDDFDQRLNKIRSAISIVITPPSTLLFGTTTSTYYQKMTQVRRGSYE